MSSNPLEELSDRLAIRDALNLYARALDRRDFALLASIFVPDATAIYSGNAVGPGIDKILEYLRGLRDTVASTHFMMNQIVTFREDAANAETYAIAHVITVGNGHNKIRTRGILYCDDLVRRDGQWLVKHRHHIPVWERKGIVEMGQREEVR